jgi:hypothetical protein
MEHPAAHHRSGFLFIGLFPCAANQLRMENGMALDGEILPCGIRHRHDHCCPVSHLLAHELLENPVQKEQIQRIKHLFTDRYHDFRNRIS